MPVGDDGLELIHPARSSRKEDAPARHSNTEQCLDKPPFEKGNSANGKQECQDQRKSDDKDRAQ